MDGEHVKNAEQLQRYLLTRAAATIPSYWFQLMRPEITEEAAVFCKARFTQVVESMYNFEGSPADRASLARRQCFLPADLSGMLSSPTSLWHGLQTMPQPPTPRGAPPSPTSPSSLPPTSPPTRAPSLPSPPPLPLPTAILPPLHLCP